MRDWINKVSKDEIANAITIFDALKEIGLGDGWKLKRTKPLSEQDLEQHPQWQTESIRKVHTTQQFGNLYVKSKKDNHRNSNQPVQLVYENPNEIGHEAENSSAKKCVYSLLNGTLELYSEKQTDHRIVTPDGMVYYLSGSFMTDNNIRFAHSFIQQKEKLLVYGQKLHNGKTEQKWEKYAEDKGYCVVVSQKNVRDEKNEASLAVAKIVSCFENNTKSNAIMLHENKLNNEMGLSTEHLKRIIFKKRENSQAIYAIHKNILSSADKGDDIDELCHDQNKSLDPHQGFSMMLGCIEEVWRLHDRELSHKKNAFIHRDIKPKNFLAKETVGLNNKQQYSITLIDFELCMSVSDIIENYTDNNIMGTLSFMAPEIIVEKKYSIRSDWYALGITLALPLLKMALYLVPEKSKELNRYIKDSTFIWNASSYVYLKLKRQLKAFDSCQQMSEEDVQMCREYVLLISALVQKGCDNIFDVIRRQWLDTYCVHAPHQFSTQTQVEQWIKEAKEREEKLNDILKVKVPQAISDPREKEIWNRFVALAESMCLLKAFFRPTEEAVRIEMMTLGMKIYHDDSEELFKRITADAIRTYQKENALPKCVLFPKHRKSGIERTDALLRHYKNSEQMKQELIRFFEEKPSLFSVGAANNNHSFIRYFLESCQKYNVSHIIKEYLGIVISENNNQTGTHYFFSAEAKKESQEWMKVMAGKSLA